MSQLVLLLAPLAVPLSAAPLFASVTSRRALLLAPLVVPLSAHAVNPVANSNLVRDGMAAFAANHVDTAISLFDESIAENPALRPYLWQRGLALYYAGRFADGAEQFAADVAVNANDTEEEIWHLLCLAQLKGGLEAARPFRLRVGTDRRPVMRAAQALFLSGSDADEAQLADIARAGDTSSRFYAALYLSLYFESLGAMVEAKRWMLEAVGVEYARGVGRADPMVELAGVAVQRREWARPRD